jgi:ferric-dicitrate binding protein FerR (iron transport regulator)
VGKSSHTPSPELIALLSEVTDGQADDERCERLSHLLNADDNALRFYAEWVALHAALHRDLTAGSSASIDLLLGRTATEAPSRSSARWLSAWGWSLAAGLAAVVAGLVVAGRGSNTGRAEALRQFQSPASNAVAMVAEAVDARWAEGSEHPVGSPLSTGTLRLEQGIVQIDLLSGANLVVEGPAEIDLVSPMRVAFRKGRLRAHVPHQAIGFTVDTPSDRVVDMGTEFAVNVANGETEIHVLDGEVRVEDALEPPRRGPAPQSTVLTLGMGLRRSSDGALGPIQADPVGFVGSRRLMEISSSDSATRREDWQRRSSVTALDPNAILYYSFHEQDAWDRVLLDSGQHDDADLDGAIIGCRWVEGRWPWKRGLEFKRTNDRVRLNVAGEYASVTYSCWVRIDGFDRWLSSLVLTDGHEVGEPHWQFTETGQLLLGVKADENKSQEYLSPSVLKLTDLGRWVHLACVYDGPRGRVSHYVDGKEVSTHEVKKSTTLRFGPTQVGNWESRGFVDHVVRSLNGRIDELLLLDVPLSSDEVAELYRTGRP